MEDFLYEAVEIIQTIWDGILFGSTYALIGIGFTLIFGAMGKLNMAYAAAAIAGAYVGLAVEKHLREQKLQFLMLQLLWFLQYQQLFPRLWAT